METKTCNINHLEADALLPPHKRLLAGLKKHVPDSTSSASSVSCCADTAYDIRLNNLLQAHLSNTNLSNKEIAKFSKRAAMKAAQIAEAKRANAEQKAIKAAKAVSAAKKALELVADLEDEAAKKLYDMDKGDNSNCGADEEMARNLHRAINSSTRILSHKPKKMKVDTEGCIKEIDKVDLDNVNGNMSRASLEKDGFYELLNGLGKKKGRVKTKKLSLSVCSFRDQTSPKDDLKSCVGTSNNGLTSVETWKCQEFRTSACASQSKVMQL